MRPLPHPSDGELIAELRARGYRVYPHQRVRVFGAQESISRRNLFEAPPSVIERLVERAKRDAAIGMGVELLRCGAIVQTTQDVASGRMYRGSLAVVLPRDFDFERDTWEVGHGERPVTES